MEQVSLAPRVEARLARLSVKNGLPPPTQLERRLYRTLERLGVRYVPEMPFPPYRTDVFLPAWGIALESDGCAVHSCKRCYYEQYADVHERKRAARDRRLMAQYHVLTLHIWEHDGLTDDAMYATVVKILRPYCQAAPWAREVREA